MKILAVDQARNGAWSVFDYDTKKLLNYGTFSFQDGKYSFPQAVRQIELLIEQVIHDNGVDAVFYEDIQLRQNVLSFKRLAQLQGVLVNLAERNEYPYDLIAPTQWQSFCGARDRTAKEAKQKITSLDSGAKKTSKILSIQALYNIFGIETDNDNLADAVLIGWYVVNKYKLKENLTNA